MRGDQGRPDGEDREVLTMLDRAATRTAVPTWEPDLDAVVRRGVARRRRVQAGLTGLVAVAAAAVVGVTATVGAPFVDSAPDVADRAPEVVGVDGPHPGPTTFDDLGERPGLCPSPVDEAGEMRTDLPDGRPAVVPADVAAPLLDRLRDAVADAGLEPADWTVERSASMLAEAPCGPVYDVLPADEAGTVSLRVTWLGTSPPRGVCEDEQSELCGSGTVDGVARWRSAPMASEVTDDGGITEVGGVDLVVELVGDDEALLSDATRPAPAEVPVVELVALGDVTAGDLLGVALAESWHALAAQVEADVLAGAGATAVEGPTTYDELALDDGRCPEGRGADALDGRPVDVAPALAAPLVDAFVAAGGAEVGPTTVATVSRPPTLGSTPCGPSYTLEGTLDRAAYTATVTWTTAVGFVAECDPVAPVDACEVLDVDGATVVVQRDTIRGRVLLTVTREPGTPGATGMIMGLSDLEAPVEPVARLLLAEDWHALAAEVEAAVVSADGEGTAPEALCGRGTSPVEDAAAEPLVGALEREITGLGLETAGPATVTRSRARFTEDCVQVLTVSLPVATASGTATVELTTGWFTDLFHALACDEATGCTEAVEQSYTVRTLEPPARRQVVAAPGTDHTADDPAVSLAAEPEVDLTTAELTRLAVGVDWEPLAAEVVEAVRSGS